MGNVHNDPRDGSGRPADGTPDEAQHRRMDPMRKVALAGGLSASSRSRPPSRS
jgi:hypothetical protein